MYRNTCEAAITFVQANLKLKCLDNFSENTPISSSWYFLQQFMCSSVPTDRWADRHSKLNWRSTELWPYLKIFFNAKRISNRDKVKPLNQLWDEQHSVVSAQLWVQAGGHTCGWHNHSSAGTIVGTWVHHSAGFVLLWGLVHDVISLLTELSFHYLKWVLSWCNCFIDCILANCVSIISSKHHDASS
jgi:hypothetical protein